MRSINYHPLTWSLVIATYKRFDVLRRCLRLAALQTRAALEVIVVDASPDWSESKFVIQGEFSRLFPNIPLIYLQARTASITAQRNQGVDIASGDIVFLIDDDSLMYEDCAEAVMHVYETDVDGLIKGVSAVHTPTLPKEDSCVSTALGERFLAHHPKQTQLRSLVKRLLDTESTYFLPYDMSPPLHQLPESVRHLNVGKIQIMVGHAMTFRREAVLKERFSELLRRYAAGEDQDLSYRVSRHGLLVVALDAHLCHLEASSGRLTLFQVTVLAATNPAVLQELYSSNKIYTRRKWRRILYRRLLIGILKDLSERRWTMPRGRGVVFALQHLKQIQNQSSQELESWYPEFQSRVIDPRGI